MNNASRLALWGAAMMAAWASPAAAAKYIYTDLGTLPGGTTAMATGINDAGVVVGVSGTSGGTSHAFSYANGEFTDLGTLGGHYSAAADINNIGQIVGSSEIDDSHLRTPVDHAFLYANGTMKDIGTGKRISRATGINDAGQVALTSQTGTKTNSPDRAFLYNNGVSKDLGTLGGASSTATDVNASGQVSGYSTIASRNYSHAFLYSNGVMQDLGTLGGATSNGNGINDAGEVVGNADLVNDVMNTYAFHAFLYDGSKLNDLGTLGGGNYSLAEAINNSGDVVGYSFLSNLDLHAFVYIDGKMSDLNSLIEPMPGLVLLDALAINSSGQIVGYSRINGGLDRAYLLTPTGSSSIGTPEPATWAMMTVGLGLVGGAMRRRHGGRGALPASA